MRQDLDPVGRFQTTGPRRASLVERDDDRRHWTVTAGDGTALAGPFLSRSLADGWEIEDWESRVSEAGYVPPSPLTQ